MLLRDSIADPAGRLEAVLEAYALIAHELRRHHDSELAVSCTGTCTSREHTSTCATWPMSF